MGNNPVHAIERATSRGRLSHSSTNSTVTAAEKLEVTDYAACFLFVCFFFALESSYSTYDLLIDYVNKST